MTAERIPLNNAKVWISSTGHLDAFRRAVARTSEQGQRTGQYVDVSMLPHIRPAWGLLGMTFPMPYLAHAELTAKREDLLLISTPPRIFGNSVRNLTEGFQWEIPAGAIILIEEYAFSSPAGSAYDIPFTRIRTALSGLAGDFLMAAASAKLNVRKLQDQSRALYGSLLELVDRSGWGRRQS